MLGGSWRNELEWYHGKLRRYGSRLSNQPIELHPNVAHWLNRARDQAPRIPPRLSASLPFKREVIRLLLENDERRYPKLDYIGLTTVLAKRFGWDAEAVLPYLKAVGSLSRPHSVFHGRRMITSGEISGSIVTAVRHGLPDIARRVLEKRRLHTIEIADRVHDELERKRKLDPSTTEMALELLAAGGEAEKLWQCNSPGNPLVWVLAKHRKTSKTIPGRSHPSRKFQVLMALYNHYKRGGKGLSYSEICRVLRAPRVGWQGTRKASLTPTLDPLIEADLVALSQKSVGGRKIDAYRLPPATVRMVERTLRQGWLDEELRLGLLGVKTLGLPVSVERRLKRIKLAADVLLTAERRLREENRCGNIAILRRVPKATLSVVERLLYTDSRPWAVLSANALRLTYFPHLSPEQRRIISMGLRDRRWLDRAKAEAKARRQLSKR